MSTKAAWTKRLISDLSRWWTCGPREISFHMAQVLSGHGCFQSYLWKRGRATSEVCCHCQSEKDDVKHSVFN
jgi:phage-related protein